MRPCVAAAFVCGLLLAASAVWPQDKPPEKTPRENKPAEYKDEEFSPFLRALRRGEIILFGSLPLTLFITYEIYDVSRYFAYGQRLEYAPWPFRPANAASYSSEDTRNVLIAAASFSLALAVADYAIGRVIAKRAARRSNQGR